MFISKNSFPEINRDMVTVSCLEDSGTEIPVLKASVIEQFDVQVIGSVKIRGIVGQPVNCKLVRLYVCLLNDDNDVTDKQSSVMPIVCAVTDEAHEQMILPRDVIERMQCMKNTEISLFEQDPGEGRSLQSEDVGQSTVNVLTRSGISTDQVPVTPGQCRSPITGQNTSNNDVIDADESSGCEIDSGFSLATRQQLIKEQCDDESLKACWKWAENGKGNMFLHDGMLMHKDRILGQELRQLVVPKGRRTQVLKIGHDMPHGRRHCKE